MLKKIVNLKTKKNSIIFVAEGKLSFETEGKSIKGEQYHCSFIANNKELSFKREGSQKAVVLIVNDTY